MKILVTGASGFIGFHTVEGLVDRGAEVSALDLEVKGSWLNKNVPWVKGDVQNMELLADLVPQFDGVIHLAGMTRLADGYLAPHACMLANTFGFMNILEASRSAAKVPWIILGSTREVQEVRFPTDHIFFQNARGVYGLSKLCSELLAQRYALDYGMRIVTLRFSDVYGSIHDNMDRVLPKLLLNALANRDLIVTEGADEHDFTYYLDTVDAIIKGIDFIQQRNVPCYEVATVCTGRGTLVRELAQMILEKTGSSSSMRLVAPSKQDAFRSSPLLNDTQRARRLLGFAAKVPLAEGLERIIQAYRSRD